MGNMNYHESGGVFLMSEIQRLVAVVANLIDELAKRDRTVAEMDARITELTKKKK